MRLLRLLRLFATLLSLTSAISSPKRGLVYVQGKNPSDDNIWIRAAGSNLTWYYNYGEMPTPALRSSRLHYVPMLWGPSSSRTGSSFADVVKSLINQGNNITHVLGFNEPDEARKNGGSDMTTDAAAAMWIREIEPLKTLGIKLGAPAVTGSPRGLDWFADFLKKCKGGCTFDFLPIHWYGNFEGLASYVGQVKVAYPNTTFWVTEFGYPKEDLSVTQKFFNDSTELFDNSEAISRYAYFGAFRSDSSNIGPSAAMLNQQGRLTDIGSWYLGGNTTGAGSHTTSLPAGWSMSVALISLLALLV